MGEDNYLLAGKTIRDIVEAIVSDTVNTFSPENSMDKTFEQIHALDGKGVYDENIVNILHNLREIGNAASHDGGAKLDNDAVIQADNVIPRLIDAYSSLAA